MPTATYLKGDRVAFVTDVQRMHPRTIDTDTRGTVTSDQRGEMVTVRRDGRKTGDTWHINSVYRVRK